MEFRKQAILRAVVNEFTTSAVPVGSQALQSRYFVNLSSATIRSELAELAEAGYLAQPHTSAGRIPTDHGYRYFVDFLMDLEAVPESVRTYIRDELVKAPSDVQGLVEKVAMTAAAVTQNAAVASAPQGSQAGMKHVDVVSLEPTEVLLILLLDGNLLRQQVLHVSEPATQVALTRLAAKLNHALAGRLSDDVRRHYQNSELGLEKEVVGSIVAALDQYEKGAENLVVHDGVRNLVRQPEFAESSRLQQPAAGARGSGGDALLDRAAARAHRRVRPADSDRVREHVGAAAGMRGGAHQLRPVAPAEGRARRDRADADGLQPDSRALARGCACGE